MLTMNQHRCLLLSGEDRLQSPALCLLSFNQLSMLMRAFPSFCSNLLPCHLVTWSSWWGTLSNVLWKFKQTVFTVYPLFPSFLAISWTFSQISEVWLLSTKAVICFYENTVSSSFTHYVILYYYGIPLCCFFLFVCFSLYIIIQISLMPTKLWRGCPFCDHRLFCMKT